MEQLFSREMLYWGWVRFLVGSLQMVSAVAAVLLIIQTGLGPVTWAFIALATMATLLSRVLYRGRKGPAPDSTLKRG